MKWKDPTKELPPLDKTYRCIADIYIDRGLSSWKGYVDVAFNAKRGWIRCETQEMVEIKRYVYIHEFEGELSDE